MPGLLIVFRVGLWGQNAVGTVTQVREFKQANFEIQLEIVKDVDLRVISVISC